MEKEVWLEENRDGGVILHIGEQAINCPPRTADLCYSRFFAELAVRRVDGCAPALAIWHGGHADKQIVTVLCADGRQNIVVLKRGEDYEI